MCNYLSCILVSAIAQAVSAMAGAVSHQPLTVEAQVRYLAVLVGFMVDRVARFMVDRVALG
jgi:hypothetical protein